MSRTRRSVPTCAGATLAHNPRQTSRPVHLSAAGPVTRPRLRDGPLGVGLCGAPTTYSTFSYETFRLAETGAVFFAVANVVASIVAGLGAVFIGLTPAQAIAG
ncbi:fluoride efflux transporter FluC [Nonomuraea sp. NPDC049714]|uniref:fluoride efflux transporter FluC n=1 Tax=Nonomuraea sp. NPDC049714 TaxID=3364357 RepID=UPI003791C86F